MKKKTIFTTITLGLVTLLGLGFLGAINSQPKEAKASEITTQPTKKYAKVSDISTILDNNNIYYFVAKNYEQNGEGVFYEGSINLANSAIVTMSNASLGSELGFTEIRNNAKTPTSLSFVTAQSAGTYHIKDILISRGNDYVNTYLYHATDSSGYFKRELAGFIGTQLFIRNNPTECLWYVNKFFNIYQLQDNYFEFAETINYNATYGQDIDSFVINDNYFSDNTQLFKQVTLYSGVPFLSGGLVFDTIVLSFDNAYATKFRTSDNNIQAWSSFNFGYFHEMRYINSVTNYIVSVNNRIFEAYYNANESGYYLTKRSKWISTSYQKITFFDNVQDTTIVELSKLNNSSYSGGYYENYGQDVGLGNAFALISQAFTAWLPILQVSIVPGITLGLLLFLPLIAGIIIFIIWIVKR